MKTFCQKKKLIPASLLLLIMAACTERDNTLPTASFSFTSTRSLPAFVQFTNQSNHSVGSTYVWDFGDGSSSTQQHPLHTYPNQGVYQVSLTHTPPSGPVEAVTKVISIATTGPTGVSNRPGNTQAADFSAVVTYSVPYFVTFTNTSQESDLYHWNFGDNTTSNSGATTVTHTYNTPGPFYVILTASNINGSDTSGSFIRF
jgi:PKD repeat protein